MRTALSRRKEFNCTTWVLFLDLIKAFDRVHREMLWRVLEKFGVPTKIIDLVKALYFGSSLTLEIESVNVTMPSTTGVKQGDNLASTLFKIAVQAVFDSIRWPDNCQPLHFKTKIDGVTCSRLTSAKSIGSDFAVRESLYADDAAVMFDSREALESGGNELIRHLARFGLQAHYAPEGTDPKKSKTVAMVFEPHVRQPNQQHQQPDLPEPIQIQPNIVAETTYPAGQVPFVNSFKYLGSTINSWLDDNDDVGSRIQSASQVFGALRCVFDLPKLSIESKAKLYTACVLSVALYGSEGWCETAANVRRLSVFHNRCCRALARVTRWTQWKHRIRSEHILQQVGLKQIQYFIDQRAIRWIGHIARMGDTRLPKMLFFSWAPGQKRKVGRTQKHYGHRIKHLLVELAAKQTARESHLQCSTLATNATKVYKARQKRTGQE